MQRYNKMLKPQKYFGISALCDDKKQQNNRKFYDYETAVILLRQCGNPITNVA